MALKPLRPCRHPGCGALTREGYCPKHKPQKAPRRVSAEYHSWYSLPIWTDDLRPAQLLRSPSAGCVPPSIRREIPGAAPGPRWWITSSPTVGTGRSLSTRATTRACASITTTRRRPGSRLRNGGKIGADSTGTAVQTLDAWAQACRGAHTRAGAGRPKASTPSPHPQKVSGAMSKDRKAPFTRKIFPRGATERSETMPEPDSPQTLSRPTGRNTSARAKRTSAVIRRSMCRPRIGPNRRGGC